MFTELARLPFNSWQVHYLCHLMRMKTLCQAHVDTKPPSMPSWNYYKPENLCADFDQERKWKRANAHLLRQILKMKYVPGNVDCYNTRNDLRSKTTDMKKRLKDLEKVNFRLGCDILNAKPKIDTRSKLDSSASTRHKRHRKLMHVPKGVFKYFAKMVEPSIMPLLSKLLRPRIFFDLAVQNTHSLGRIVVQLFTEACPEVVLEMVRMATNRMANLFRLIRIFPDLWIEGEILVSNAILQKGKFLHSAKVLDHGLGAGVLSFRRDNLEGFRNNAINFSINLKPLPVLNEKRIGFGLITSGLRTLDCVQEYGTRNGKTKKKIICVGLGIVGD